MRLRQCGCRGTNCTQGCSFYYLKTLKVLQHFTVYKPRSHLPKFSCRPQPEAAGAHPSRTAAEPFIPSGGDPSRSTACDRYMAIHSRLNVIEETVEKTVEHLEAEVKGLLGQLEELAWNLPPGPFSPIPDLLGDGDSS
uniref:Placenta associated 9 n=1 Tax=Sus scrofa TaxID=9823 RepID=A0A4X1SI49_PIG